MGAETGWRHWRVEQCCSKGSIVCLICESELVSCGITAPNRLTTWPSLTNNLHLLMNLAKEGKVKQSKVQDLEGMPLPLFHIFVHLLVGP